MPFEKGKTGNPGGRPKQKEFTDALRIALKEEDPASKKKKLRVVAEKLIENAMNGDNTAIKEIADRIEGKPAQAITNGDDGPLEIIVRRFAPTDNTE